MLSGELLVDGTPVELWEDCAKPGCGNKRCARLNSRFCYPHSTDPASMVVKELDTIVEVGVEIPVEVPA